MFLVGFIVGAAASAAFILYGNGDLLIRLGEQLRKSTGSFGAWRRGPVSTMMLGDVGAEVIKLEERVGGDPGRGVMSIAGSQTGGEGKRNYYFEANNRHKKSLTLDLKKPKAQEIVYRLVEKSDVFVQNFRKGVAARLGLDY